MLRLFTSKPDHPLADTREVKRILAELEKQGAAAAIDDISIWLESLSSADGIKPEQHLELLFQFDAVAQPHCRRLAREYASALQQSHRQDSQRWLLSRGFWSLLIEAYEAQLNKVLRKEKGSEVLQSHLGMLAARLLHAQGARLKWDQFHYGPISDVLWGSLGATYLAAVTAGLANKPLQLYSAPEEKSSVQTEYLKSLVFQASSMDNLPPLEIELAEHLIAHFLPDFNFSEQFRADSVYWVDCAKPLPPTRLARNPEATPSLRFFNAGNAMTALEQLLKQIKANNAVPPVLKLSGQYSVETVVRVLEHLAMYWAAKPPMREHARYAVKSPLSAIPGFNMAHQTLADGGTNATLETWTVDDVSQGGMGVQAPLSNNEHLAIGTWVALQPQGGSNWLVGVVRRLSKESAFAQLGIETLSKVPLALSADSDGIATEIFLLEPYEENTSVRVALPGAAWEDGLPLSFHVGKRLVQLRPQELLEKGHDFAIGRYKVEVLESLV